MRTTARMTLTVLVGGLALAIAGASCRQTGPNSSGSGGKGSGGTTSSGGSGSGGSGSGGTTSSGGSSATGGSDSGGTTSSGGSNSGGSSASGGSNDTGGSNAGGSNAGGSSDTGGSNAGGSNAGGSSSGGSSGNGGSANGGSSDTGGSASGGSSDTGGSTGTGGTTETGGSSGTGGSSQGVLNCASPLTPSDGVVTDFSDYSTSSGKWGPTSGLYGAVYGYAGPQGSTMKATVDTTAKNLHFVGTVNAGDYAGGGLSFYACATAASYTKVSFSLAGSFGGTASACDLELQVQTYDQRPTTQTPPGGCDSSAGSCYGYPVAKKIGTPVSTATTLTLNLADFSNWSTANAKQVVGLQWQVTVAPASATGDAALPACTADFTIDDIKFQ